MSFFYPDARLFKATLNAYPPYWGTGISITKASPEFHRMVVRMKKRSRACCRSVPPKSNKA